MYIYGDKLTKLLLGRIQKYWDRIMPADYPYSSSEFSLKFDTDEIKAAVEKFENELETEESVVLSVLPENTFVSKYIGVYEVKGAVDELTLLSPEKVDSENVIAMHYLTESDSWEKIEDIEIKDGYIWGKLTSFSPIAIVEYMKDIHIESSISYNVPFESYIVCEGHTVMIEDNDNNNPVVKSLISGTEIEITNKAMVIGGSIDGTAIKSTNVIVKNVTNSKLLNKVAAGSLYTGEGFTTVDSVNLHVENSNVGIVTGSIGAIRTNNVLFNLINDRITYIGAAEGYAKVNTSEPSFASRAWAANVVLNIKDCNAEIVFSSANNEYFYVDNTNLNIDGGNYGYVISGGSNARTNKSVSVINNSTVGIFQTTNRGNVADASAKFRGCSVKNLFVGGDATDNTVTGTTSKLRYEIFAGKGSYNLVNGTESGALMTSEDINRIVDYIKVSRNAELTVDDNLKDIIGNKLIIK